jgi:hypothetical protein
LLAFRDSRADLGSFRQAFQPLGEVIGWGWMEKVHPDDVAFKVRTWLQNLESGKPHDACGLASQTGTLWFLPNQAVE